MVRPASFAAFRDELVRRHGIAGDDIRHELFFQRYRTAPLARAWAALAHDAWLLRRPPVPAQPAPPRNRPWAVLVATLAGGNGWGTLARALPSVTAAGLQPVVLAHPRLDQAVFPPSVPVLRPFLMGWPLLALPSAAGAEAAALARRRMWRRAVAAALDGGRGVLLLHNDFDPMSGATLAQGWPSICLQHGAPTDEFFPARADFQVVWGDSSAQAQASAGTDPARLVLDPLGRGDRAVAVAEPPKALALVSQTHAAIFGPDLKPALRRVAAELARLSGTEVPLAALLHPAEGGRNPYALAASLPPHPWLEHQRPALVLAFCSTMAVDAALAGHWVACLDLGLPGNAGAHAVADPPLRVDSAAAAVALYRRLHADPGFRAQAGACQQRWLDATFSAEREGLLGLLRKVTLR